MPLTISLSLSLSAGVSGSQLSPSLSPAVSRQKETEEDALTHQERDGPPCLYPASPLSLSPYLLSSLSLSSLFSLSLLSSLFSLSPRVFLTWLSDITENLLYVLWRHLQFYLMHCKPVGGARAMGVGGASFTRPTMRRIDGLFTVLHHSYHLIRTTELWV